MAKWYFTNYFSEDIFMSMQNFIFSLFVWKFHISYMCGIMDHLIGKMGRPTVVPRTNP